MKIIFLVLFAMSGLLVGCDREALQGLNLKINTEVKSDYDKEDTEIEEVEEVKDNIGESSTETDNNISSEVDPNPLESKTENNPSQSISENNTEVTNGIEKDPDEPMPFKEISNCSKSGITAKTNEIFYADNSHLKSIDSKDEKQMKIWKKIYSEVEKECNN
ncbi:hypothetical protein [Geminocystis sp. NIES-3709]|uniref:hypothetical protein n=1 Tax=Geminocystis sp. NIES-3709 TaxID=1617448 RepID=UPI0005FC86F5|nr:hypothetical protein [Geminocystis sp. NIES-3709]BAQ64764.1 hypothetical protein GM3709_1529 [Geminocystis sp. NIES-3709]